MENQNNQNQERSLLDEIIASSKENTNNVISNSNIDWSWQNPNTIWQWPNQSNNQEKKEIRKPMDMVTVLKLIGSLFLITIIFFGGFLAYIVFNPDQSQFFVNVFGVNPNDIANILKKLINYSFWTISFILSAWFIITWFNAIHTPKEQKRRKVVNWIFAIFFGIILFSVLTLWATIYAKIWSVNFSNLSWSILVYENNIFIYNESITNNGQKLPDRMNSLNNLIWPITLRYDISEQAKKLERENWKKIEEFTLNFDWAVCSSWDDTIKWWDPKSEKSIVCTFDKVKKYQPKWKYKFVDIAWQPEEYDFNLDPVEIRWLLTISEQENSQWDMLFNIDANNITRLGKPIWYRSDVETEFNNQNSFTVKITDTPTIIWLKVFSDTKNVDRYFIVQRHDKTESEWQINIIQNSANLQEYIFSVEGLTIDKNQIISFEWFLWINQICHDKKSWTCTYIFNNPGEWSVKAVVNLIWNKKLTFNKNLKINEPIKLERNVKITNRSWKILNTKETYDIKTKQYIIKDIYPPETIILDSRDVISTNNWYELTDVKWVISEWWKIKEEKTWKRIEFDIKRTTRYSIIADYTFTKTIKTWQEDDIKKASDNILLDLEQRSITPILKIQKTSDYVPSKITVDASQTKSEFSEIIKFEFDFGEWRPITVGDAVQTYEYTTSWEKTITLTAIDANWEKATTKARVILKDSPRTLNFTTSLSPWITGKTVDFQATGTNWQIEDYLWNFGDNTPVEHWYETGHTFRKAWKYNVTLTVKYTDWTERSFSKKFIIVDTLE